MEGMFQQKKVEIQSVELLLSVLFDFFSTVGNRLVAAILLSFSSIHHDVVKIIPRRWTKSLLTWILCPSIVPLMLQLIPRRRRSQCWTWWCVGSLFWIWSPGWLLLSADASSVLTSALCWAAGALSDERPPAGRAVTSSQYRLNVLHR